MISDPFDRVKLLDLLRPPEGFWLDEAIGTTYSLDLPALLVAPLAFTLFDAEEKDGQIRLQSLEVLESLRRYAKKLTVFCHAGRIVSPTVRFTQFVHLENMIVECLPRSGGSFHPKMWVLRFAGANDAVTYRLLCLTRNLTFDRSWDTALALEGPLANRNIARNRPLADFVSALPSFAHSEVPERVQTRIGRLAAELRRVDFENPSGVDEIRFWPMGVDGYRKLPFADDGRRMLVMSPFLSETFLKGLLKDRPQSVLISTLPAIGALGARPASLKTVYTLDNAAVVEPQAEGDGDGSLETIACGLHAKCYVVDDGWSARVFTGSANATSSAFQRNVEFLVEIEGTRNQLGIDALLSREIGATRLADLLVEVPESDQLAEVDEQAVEIEKSLEAARSAVIDSSLSLLCTPVDGIAGTYDVSLETDRTVAIPIGVTITCWPVTLGEDRAVPLHMSERVAAAFSGLTTLALTRFTNVQLTAGEGPLRRSVSFALMLPIHGAPADREEQILRSILSDRSKLVQYLFLLVADDATTRDGQTIALDLPRGASADSSSAFAAPALLETFLRALDRAPERLDRVHRLVSDLRATEEGRQLLPPDFDAVWTAVWEARERGRSCPAS